MRDRIPSGFSESHGKEELDPEVLDVESYRKDGDILNVLETITKLADKVGSDNDELPDILLELGKGIVAAEISELQMLKDTGVNSDSLVWKAHEEMRTLGYTLGDIGEQSDSAEQALETLHATLEQLRVEVRQN